MLDVHDLCTKPLTSLSCLFQFANRDVVAQEIVAHEAIYKLSKLLDQFCERMKKLRLLPLIRCFPEMFAPLFTFTGNISVNEVLEALFIHDETVVHPDDEKTFAFLQEFIRGCSRKGGYIILPVAR